MTVMNQEPGAREQAEADRLERIKEYGKYRAKVPIDLNGVRAFNVGDPVPISHVESWDREVQTTKYDPETGQHVPQTRMVNGREVAVTHTEAVRPVVFREDVYQVGGKDDPNMDPPEPLKRPADGASLDKWQAYAVEQGMTADEVAAITDKADFVARYPKVEG
jgi:hypothetical protein